MFIRCRACSSVSDEEQETSCCTEISCETFRLTPAAPCSATARTASRSVNIPTAVLHSVSTTSLTTSAPILLARINWAAMATVSFIRTVATRAVFLRRMSPTCIATSFDRHSPDDMPSERQDAPLATLTMRIEGKLRAREIIPRGCSGPPAHSGKGLWLPQIYSNFSERLLLRLLQSGGLDVVAKCFLFELVFADPPFDDVADRNQADNHAFLDHRQMPEFSQ